MSPDAVSQAAMLTPCAVMSHYPGQYEPVTGDEYRAGLALAEAVVSWAKALA